MQYKFSINQFALCITGLLDKLDIIDAALFDFVQTWFNVKRSPKEMIDGRVYVQVSLKRLSKECPLLHINNRETFNKRMTKLVDAGLLIRYCNNQSEGKSLYARGELFDDMFLTPNDCQQPLTGGVSDDLQGVSANTDTYNIPFNNNIGLSNDKPLSISSEDNNKLLSSSNTDAVDTHASKVSYKSIIDYWNEHAAPRGYSKLTAISGKRLTYVRARIAEHGQDAFFSAIDKAATSDFLRGQNRNNFIMTFDWMIKPTNFPKVLEGNYDNPQTTPTTNGTDNHNTGHLCAQDNAAGPVQEPFFVLDEERLRLWETKRIVVP